MDAELHQALSRIPLVDPAQARVVPLSGGITNRNFRIEFDEHCLVLRLGGKNTDLLGIDRTVEAAAAAWAHTAGVGAEVILADPQADVMVTRFIPGAALKVEELLPDVLLCLAEVMRTVHSAPAVGRHFSPFGAMRDYLELARALQVEFPPNLDEALEQARQLEEALASSAEPCLCHNDLLPGNFLHDGERWRLIDWEYAAMGDPFFDLGNFAVNLGLDEAGRYSLLSAYLGEVKAADVSRLDMMRLASDLREAFWGFLQCGISNLEFDFASYARRHLDRFLIQVKEV